MITNCDAVNHPDVRGEQIITQALRCFITLQLLSDNPQAQADAEDAAIILLAQNLSQPASTVDLTEL